MHSILAARTDFSIGESILDPKRLVEEAKNAGAKAVGVTDTMSVTSLIQLTNAAKKADIKPIIGVRLRISDNPAWRPAKGEKKKAMPPVYYLTAYVLSEKGLKAIFRLLSLSFQEDHFYYDNKLSMQDIHDELVNLTEADLTLATGEERSILMHPEADRLVQELIDMGFPPFATLVPINTPYFGRLNELAIRAFHTLGLEFLTVRPAFYAKGEHDAHSLMKGVTSNTPLNSKWAKIAHNDDFHVVSTKELIAEIKTAGEHLNARGKKDVGPYFIEGLKNTARLVDSVTYLWTKQGVTLPKLASDEFAEIVRMCREGWKTRFTQEVFGHKPTDDELVNVYKPRLAYELSVLKKLDFAGYFLLVNDTVQYAKSNGILVGPGRGSVGGSLVAYLMGITDCDPIRFGLLFERFINPDRIDLPDIDLDFMSERRHEVIEYLVKKYGQSRVAGVSNYGALAAASCIRDLGRMIGLTDRDTRCSKLVPKAHGAHIPLPECAIQVPEIEEFAKKNPALWPIMTRLEGTMRTYGTHAAGVIVGGEDLVNRGVVERRKDNTVMCWDKVIVEDMGLVKMDVLGLSTLDLINLTLKYIRERHGKKVNLMRIPLDDSEVLSNFALGLTTGVFQFESGGMRRLLKELGADGVISFDDITAATALYRPGPMESGMMDSYYLRKQGRETVEYDHELMEPILKPTFGVMVYQEQVMQVARTIAGYSAPDADKLRKIMGKKLPEEMKKERGKFVEGCVATVQCDEDWAGELFDKIEGFAGYGFNKSHSVEYSLISWQSMWLKTKYPVEFFAAALTLMDEDKLPALIRDAERFGIDVSMPDINISTDRFEIATDVRLVIPFQRIKGVGPGTVQAILEARKTGQFKDKADFLARVEKRRCNVKHQDLLDRVGAFCRIEPTQPSAKDPSRIRDLIELIPGLISEYVPINRDMNTGKNVTIDLQEVMTDCIATLGATGEGDGQPVNPWQGKTPRFVIITDAPGHTEERNRKMGTGDQIQCIYQAMSTHAMSAQDVYWTGLIKRPKADKQVSLDEVTKYKPYLERELAILEPTVIVMMGAQTVRYFLPDFKGKASDMAGKVIYDKERDCNLVVGFNPGEIYFDPTKQTLMEDVFKSVVDLLP